SFVRIFVSIEPLRGPSVKPLPTTALLFQALFANREKDTWLPLGIAVGAILRVCFTKDSEGQPVLRRGGVRRGRTVCRVGRSGGGVGHPGLSQFLRWPARPPLAEAAPRRLRSSRRPRRGAAVGRP